MMRYKAEDSTSILCYFVHDQAWSMSCCHLIVCNIIFSDIMVFNLYYSIYKYLNSHIHILCMKICIDGMSLTNTWFVNICNLFYASYWNLKYECVNLTKIRTYSEVCLILWTTWSPVWQNTYIFIVLHFILTRHRRKRKKDQHNCK